MSKKIWIDMCHGCGEDRGAVSIANEEIESDKLTALVVPMLRQLGYIVNATRPTGNYTEEGSCYKRAELANNWGADIFVSIHNNAGGGIGAEAYTFNGEKTATAKRYLEYILSHGGKTHDGTLKHNTVDGAIKPHNGLIVIRETNMEAILLENFYVDTKEDYNFFKANINMFACAIVYAITGVDLGKKQISNNNNEVKVDMKTIVLYFGDMDANAAIYVAQKNQCPMMKKCDFDVSGLKVEKIIQIGGKFGSTRYDSLKDAGKLV
ncbi:N-acetylmuramoyl-L-alanine amidase [Clostridium ihumii]|uniref:N-acetylmuramoyl-L-alanine amidase n=1 Tax=Clostridium ihumii TaxID=1470356 RepID=UPI0006878718|nr:N-acetylmuramoyl-L-alanine amidase [Clostridium ihumii]